MSVVGVRHPAKFNDAILDAIATHVGFVDRLLDPFAGTGRIHELQGRCAAETVGVEIEPEWAALHPRTVVGDSRYLVDRFGLASFDAVATSCTYGNRMADHHDANDDSRRNTYRHALGRPLTEGNSGGMQWGDDYRALHAVVWGQCHAVLRHGGVLVLNVKDHIRRGAVVPVTDWHVATLESIGFAALQRAEVPCGGLRFGENHAARVDHESVISFRRGSA